MRFAIAGDAEIPDYILADFVLLAELEHKRFGKLSKIVVGYLSGTTASLTESSLSLLGFTTSLQNSKTILSRENELLHHAFSNTKAILISTLYIFRNGAAYNVDTDRFTEELQQLGLPTEHSQTSAELLDSSRKRIRAHLFKGHSLFIPRLLSVSWHVDIILSSSTLPEPIAEPVIHLSISSTTFDFPSKSAFLAKSTLEVLHQQLEPFSQPPIQKTSISMSLQESKRLLSELKRIKSIIQDLS